MCGFAGIYSSSADILAQKSKSLFDRHASLIQHRGNTDSRSIENDTYWVTHHRLAFQDLALGMQPMFDSTGHWFIIFNGEIYNHLELRNRIPALSNFPFKTRSDTETLLEGYLAHRNSHSETDFFDKLDGEFAFVIARKDGSELLAHRDPSGVKPLFLSLAKVDTDLFAHYKREYAFHTTDIGFSSEMKGLMHSKTWSRTGLLRQFVGLYEPIRTPFQEIIQILPGSVFYAKLGSNGASENAYERFFSCRLSSKLRAVRRPAVLEYSRSKKAVQDDFQPLDTSLFLSALEKSVKARLLSDVELGVYLSGGVDSRTIASMLGNIQEKSASSFGKKAFTVGFSQEGYDESTAALHFARHQGFTTHLLNMTDETLSYAYPLAVQTSENIQPYTNGAAKWWLSLMTRQYVQGVLTGDGADELLCGYPSYRYVKWWKHIMRARKNKLSQLRTKPLGQMPRDELYVQVFAAQSENPWLAGASAQGTGLDFIESLALWGVAHPLFGQIQSIAEILLGKDAQPWLESQAESIRSWFRSGLDSDLDLTDARHSLVLWQNYFYRTHLPVQVLNWVGDRMEMANVLEGRTPFLGKDLRDFVYELPDRAMISGFTDKFILRRSIEKIMPAQFASQPKKQFGAPFLDTHGLLQEFEAKEAFDAVGLSGHNIFERIEEKRARLVSLLATIGHGPSNTIKSNATDKNVSFQFDPRVADARFELSHLEQVRQTAVTLGIIHHSLVLGQHLQRNHDFEEKTLQNTRVEKPHSI